jgi:cation diffusion facilitator family transporter
MTTSADNYNIQKKVVTISLLLFAIKIVAWIITGSVAIMTDALESIVNVVSGFIGLYSLYLASLPKDRNHPYGHGKVELLSAATEGVLISVAGLIIIYEAVQQIRNPQAIQQLDYGIILIALAGTVNYAAGLYAVSKGSAHKSPALIASGKHLQSDAYSTLGILAGLALLYFTGWAWLDSITALVFAGIIIFTGVRIVSESVSGIMDEADELLLNEMVDVIQAARRPNWIDLHNLRIIKYGTTLHMDCHLTVPWYFNVKEAHDEIEYLEQLVRESFGESVELFVHTDACRDFSCRLCSKSDCTVRLFTFEMQIEWTIENISENKRHQL